MKKQKPFWYIVLAVLVIDQFTKYSVRYSMALGKSIPIIRNIFHLTYIQNTGAGFGILKGQQTALIFFTILVVGAILYSYEKIPKDKFSLKALFSEAAKGDPKLIMDVAKAFVVSKIKLK